MQAPKMINPAQLKKLNTLISKAGLDKETKAERVMGFSGGRVSSTTGLTYAEAHLMIQDFEPTADNKDGTEKLKRTVIYWAHEMGWHRYERGKNRVDMERLNSWCIKFGHGHKALDQYSYNELPKLITQIKQAYQDYLQTF